MEEEQRMKTTNKKKPATYTFDEYQKKFFPVSSKRQTFKEEDPYKVGLNLAKESLNKVKHILAHR